MPRYYAPTTAEISEREILHEKILREMAGECIVLLENDGTLPLKKIANIALYGAGARDTIAGGTGSGAVNARKTVNIEQGLENAGFTITTKKWLNRQEKKISIAKQEFIKYCEEEAERTNNVSIMIALNNPFKEPSAEMITEQDVIDSATETAIYVLHRVSGEFTDRFDTEGDYYLYAEEKKSIEYLVSSYKQVIVVLNIGGIINIRDICDIKGVNAIVLMTQLGNVGGDSFTDVLTGKVNPSGKTTDTWAEEYMDYPSSEDFSHNGSVHDEYYREGIYVGYRYFDSFRVRPRYPFGYGRSYTTFKISCLSIQLNNNEIKMRLRIKNIGEEYAGKEVVQVYYSAPAAALDKPVKELITFKKTPLIAPDGYVDMSVSFQAENMASYSEAGAAWILEKGNYNILVGNSSENLQEIATISLNSDVKTRILRNVFPLDVKMDEISNARIREANYPRAVNHVNLQLEPDAIKTEEISYQTQRFLYKNAKNEQLTLDDIRKGNCSIEELVSQMSTEEMAQICVGTLREENGSVIGNASQYVPGAAGDTSSILKDTRGIPGIIMADGPAGLRLEPHFQEIKDKEVIDYYQYCTAIPIGWALAQSWNTELVEKVGCVIGKEMEEFHIDLWLAPAFNIHRNPLCGRNFEYYSEDPVISGMIGAAITKGVQKNSGKGTTIKHFAANNQEDNRYFLNAHVSERAMREIYLRGFEIAVKTSQPMALMTSYNLLNGIHTANNKDLIQHVLRDEWGFGGMVMTDWFTSQNLPAFTGKFEAQYPISSSAGCIYAGNDLQMPGCQQNVDDIVEAVRTGKCVDGYAITLADIQYCAENIIRTVLKTNAE